MVSEWYSNKTLQKTGKSQKRHRLKWPCMLKCRHSDLHDIHCVEVENIINIFALNLTDQFILLALIKWIIANRGH